MGKEPIVFRLSEMSGYDFEDAVETLFERLGYEAGVSERVSDLGRDIIARNDSETLIIECKHTSSSIGRPVIQKLHSATMSFSEDATGVLVTSSTFSSPAREHAEKLGDEVELWNYKRLVEKGRSVELYFVSEDRGTELVFRPRTPSPEEVVDALSGRLTRTLKSAPRPIERVLAVEYDRTELVPALVVDYEVDEVFGTNTYPNLHHAQERGRLVYRLDNRDFSAGEEEIWQTVSYRERCEEPIDGKPPEAYFGVDVAEYEADVERRVARRQSTTVSYRGRNNQTYTKECRVEPDDVKTKTRQVLLSYPTVDFCVGPEAYACKMTGCTDAEPTIVAAKGIEADALDRIWRGRTGYVCNDCADLAPVDADPSPETCEDCGRTLCAVHHWQFPRKTPRSWVPRCSSCYREAARGDATLRGFPFGGYGATVTAGVIPGLSFLVGGRYVIGGLFALMAAGLIATPVALEFGLEEAEPFGIALGAICLWSMLATLIWARRIRRHRANLADLDGYTPDWQGDEPDK
ncbi:MAG: restriction endonuclease [Persicimonas sp.]